MYVCMYACMHACMHVCMYVPLGYKITIFSCVSVFTEICSILQKQVRILSSWLNVFSSAASNASGIQLHTPQLFVDIPENKDFREFPRHVLVNFHFMLLESQFHSNILLKSGQDFALSLTAKIQNLQMIMASCRHESYCTESAPFVSLDIFLWLSPSLALISVPK